MEKIGHSKEESECVCVWFNVSIRFHCDNATYKRASKYTHLIERTQTTFVMITWTNDIKIGVMKNRSQALILFLTCSFVRFQRKYPKFWKPRPSTLAEFWWATNWHELLYVTSSLCCHHFMRKRWRYMCVKQSIYALITNLGQSNLFVVSSFQGNHTPRTAE